MLNSLWDEKAYVPLSTDEENESQHSSNDKAFLNGSLCNSRSKWRAVLGVLTISLAINTLALFLFIQHLHNEIHPSGSSAFSSFAGLSYNVSKRIDWTTKYSNGTDAELDELWLNEDPSQHGIVALDNSYAAAQRLHQGVPFFWKEDAGVYVVSAYHQLHCLQIIYRALKDYREGIPYDKHGSSQHHVIHCLDNLRSDIMCAADDTPRYLSEEATGAGDGQYRMCRDWAQLEAWTEKQDGCFKHIHPKDKTIAEIERFKYCKSEDSPYLPTIREFFRYPADWLPWPYREQEEYLLINGSKRKGLEA